MIQIKITYGVVADVMVETNQVIFPIDFVVLHMKENRKYPLLLGRHFFTTVRALIKVETRDFTLRVGEQGMREIKVVLNRQNHQSLEASTKEETL